MLRMCVLTVFSDTDSSAAISCRDRFVGRCRSIFSSPALIYSPATTSTKWPTKYANDHDR